MNKQLNLGLSLATNKQTLKGRGLTGAIKIALKNDADSARPREKNMDIRSTTQKTFKIREITQCMGKFLTVNDRTDITETCDVDGVHLGQKDMPVKCVREILGGGKIIGTGCHTLEQALEIQEAGAGYTGVRAIFPTFTGDDFMRVIIDMLKETPEKIHVPITTISGINKNNIRMIFDSNVGSVSLTSVVFLAGDVAASTQELEQKSDMILKK